MNSTLQSVLSESAQSADVSGACPVAALSGAGDPNATVQFTVDGRTITDTTKADKTGAWAYTPRGLANGSHTIVARETNQAGKAGEASLSFTLETSAPSVTMTLAAQPEPPSAEAAIKADHLIRLFLDEINAINRRKGDPLSIYREYRQQYGKKVSLNMFLTKDGRRLGEELMIVPLQKQWILCRSSEEKVGSGEDIDLSNFFSDPNSADADAKKVHEIVGTLMNQAKPEIPSMRSKFEAFFE
ncbi:Ig-like domain-containing protein [Lichenifustis flavocetrariae]|uniref:Ig-like domain-containing protein n=1 Tax=Lichenifustis flavocetrariae TaxID=2949735 RepID=A0AA41Z3C8_9HYPH|nr:Ig-like domain-containing protein [Lichenifustis flavocetrariae]MCW6512045.1 Ig-like domain-containing protein [Lichenifustis flavocetrariae]